MKYSEEQREQLIKAVKGRTITNLSYDEKSGFWSITLDPNSGPTFADILLKSLEGK